MEIHVTPEKIKLVAVEELQPNPKNRNKHPKEQIDRLVELIKYQGFRQPIVVSNQSGYIVTGHGRLEAAKRLALEKVPVVYQDFDSSDQEYAFGVSDNAIGAWADLDLSGINTDLGDLGPDFDIEMLGIKEFSLDPSFTPGSVDDQGQLDQKKIVILKCPHCGEKFEQGQARKLEN